MKSYIKIPENILSRFEEYNNEKLIILFNIDTNEILKGNEDMLNLILCIDKFPCLNKLIEELAKKYDVEIGPEFQSTVVESIEDLKEKGFVTISKG